QWLSGAHRPPPLRRGRVALRRALRLSLALTSPPRRPAASTRSPGPRPCAPARPASARCPRRPSPDPPRRFPRPSRPGSLPGAAVGAPRPVPRLGRREPPALAVEAQPPGQVLRLGSVVLQVDAEELPGRVPGDQVHGRSGHALLPHRGDG